MESEPSDHKSSIAIVGVIPPPFGGVSVHILREMELLRTAGFEVDLYEQSAKSDPDNSVHPLPKSKIGFFKFLMQIDCDLLHFHFSNHMASALAGLVLLLRSKQKYICTIHGEGLVKAWKGGRWWHRKLLKNYLCRADAIISVNPDVARFIQETIGVSDTELAVIPAFLPPSTEELADENIPQSVAEFISGRRVVGTHGWFGFFQDGVHVYGFDMIARLVALTKQRDIDVVFYTVISGSYDDSHREEILRLNEPLKDRWRIIEDSFICAALYGKSDLFLRPTYTDGDSVSIRECLSLGVSVIASDAVKRPDQCAVFESRNQESFNTVFLECLESLERQQSQAVEFGFDKDLIAVVRRTLGEGES